MISKRRKRWAFAFGLILMTLTGCKADERNFTIGVVGSNPFEINPTWLGFNEGMADSGYAEGENLKYIIKSVPNSDEQIIDAAIGEVLGQNIDILLALGGDLVDQRVKAIVEGSGMPVLFASYPGVKDYGLVESISHPGGNMTGVQGVRTESKAFEFLKDIIHDLKKIYVPYNPADVVSTNFLPRLKETASQMGIELIFGKINSVEEAVAAIESLTGDADAVFMIPSPTLNFRSSELSRVAIRRGLPMASGLQLQSDDDVLMTFSMDFFDSGNRLAIMARKIFSGISPSDIPVETAEVTSIINLRTAEKIGLHIPEIALAQSAKIIR